MCRKTWQNCWMKNRTSKVRQDYRHMTDYARFRIDSLVLNPVSMKYSLLWHLFIVVLILKLGNELFSLITPGCRDKFVCCTHIWSMRSVDLLCFNKRESTKTKSFEKFINSPFKDSMSWPPNLATFCQLELKRTVLTHWLLLCFE